MNAVDPAEALEGEELDAAVRENADAQAYKEDPSFKVVAQVVDQEPAAELANGDADLSTTGQHDCSQAEPTLLAQTQQVHVQISLRQGLGLVLCPAVMLWRQMQWRSRTLARKFCMLSSSTAFHDHCYQVVLRQWPSSAVAGWLSQCTSSLHLALHKQVQLQP